MTHLMDSLSEQKGIEMLNTVLQTTDLPRRKIKIIGLVECYILKLYSNDGS